MFCRVHWVITFGRRKMINVCWNNVKLSEQGIVRDFCLPCFRNNRPDPSLSCSDLFNALLSEKYTARIASNSGSPLSPDKFTYSPILVMRFRSEPLSIPVKDSIPIFRLRKAFDIGPGRKAWKRRNIFSYSRSPRKACLRNGVLKCLINWQCPVNSLC